ncbi:MAG: CCA tRNA nucleotidyltransferase [Proteobacteria bacterium]|nr:CCA tRNA nucleotidyltransferase [Pseudomonadota bacterium]
MTNRPKEKSYQQAREVLRSLIASGIPAMFAGGCVRDRLLNLPVQDYDIAVGASPEQILKITSLNGWKAIPTGIDHGTITIIANHRSYELTSLRRDVKTNGRHAVVDFENASFEVDAKRRDFTVNALFEDLDGNIIDYVDGLSDLKSKRLRFVGIPPHRIREDYLRILRFYRFWSRLGFTPDQDGIAAICLEYDGLKTISKERVGAEFWGILAGNQALQALSAMQNHGVLAVVLPFLKFDSQSLVYLSNSAPIAPEQLRPWTHLLFLIHECKMSPAILAARISEAMRWSNQRQDVLRQLLKGWNNLLNFETDLAHQMRFLDDCDFSDEGPTFVRFFGPLWNLLAEALRDAPRSKILTCLLETENLHGVTRRAPLPLSGDDIIAIRPELKGPQIGLAKSELLRTFRVGQWATRDQGLELLSSLELVRCSLNQVDRS